jgi:hypothetical protein
MGKEVKSKEIERVEKRPEDDIGPDKAKKLNRNRDKR